MVTFTSAPRIAPLSFKYFDPSTLQRTCSKSKAKSTVPNLHEDCREEANPPFQAFQQGCEDDFRPVPLQTLQIEETGNANDVENMRLAKCGTSVYHLPSGDSDYQLSCGSIPDLMLLRMGSAQLRWDDEGELKYLTASDARLNQRLLGISSADRGIHGIVASCGKTAGAFQGWIYAGPPPSGQRILNGEKFRVCIEVLEWICFVFPRVESEEPRYASEGRLLLPYLFRVLEELK